MSWWLVEGRNHHSRCTDSHSTPSVLIMLLRVSSLKSRLERIKAARAAKATSAPKTKTKTKSSSQSGTNGNSNSNSNSSKGEV